MAIGARANESINVALSPDLRAFISDCIESGEYANESEVITKALQDLRDEDDEIYYTLDTSPAIAACRESRAQMSAEEIAQMEAELMEECGLNASHFKR